MSVIAELEIPADEFELGRILTMEQGVRVELESMVPLSGRAVPFFWVQNDGKGRFEASVQDHPSVVRVREMDTQADRTLYAIDWEVERDLFFEGVGEVHAQLLNAAGTTETWRFEIRFPSQESLSAFREFCKNAHISLDVERVYNPTKPNVGPWFGLTQPQRETLVRAVEGGYYAIPRSISTQDLGDELSISDQAVTERLRRAIETLVENTLMVEELQKTEAEED